MKIHILSENQGFAALIYRGLSYHHHTSSTWYTNHTPLAEMLGSARKVFSESDAMIVAVRELSELPVVSFLVGAAIGSNLLVYSFELTSGGAFPGTLSMHDAAEHLRTSQSEVVRNAIPDFINVNDTVREDMISKSLITEDFKLEEDFGNHIAILEAISRVKGLLRDR